jgi:hypothetical protein
VSFEFSYAACQGIIRDFEEGLEKTLATSNPLIHPSSRISIGGMSHLGHLRRLTHPAATSAITLNADIRLRCSK